MLHDVTGSRHQVNERYKRVLWLRSMRRFWQSRILIVNAGSGLLLGHTVASAGMNEDEKRVGGQTIHS